MSGWQAGASTRIFPVPVGSYLGGFADRVAPSTGTNDPLEISALVVGASDRRLHLVAADIIAVDPDLVHEIAAASDISPDTLILAASHTHSGPIGVPRRLHPASRGTSEPRLRQAFVEIASEAIIAARTNVEPAALARGDALVTSAWSNRNDPHGPSDDRVRTLVVRQKQSGQMLALVVLLPTHPTILGAENLRISSDLHGGVRRASRGQGIIDVPILTLTGAAGDISTRYTRRDSSAIEVDRLGEIVAGHVLDALSSTSDLAANLVGIQKQLTLTHRPLDRAAAKTTLKAAIADWQEIGRSPHASPGDYRVAWTRVQGAEIQARIANLDPVPATLTAWRLGNEFNLATIPGELFTSLGQQIEGKTQPDSTCVIGYANGYVGYLVDQDAVQGGTYEALASPWSATTSQDVVAATIDLVKSLSEPEPTPS